MHEEDAKVSSCSSRALCRIFAWCHVQAQNCAGEGGFTIALESTYVRMYELNAHELPRHTWERNLIFICIDARAQHGALADSFAVSSSRDGAGPGVVQQHYLLTRGKTAGLQTSGSVKKCFFSSSLLHLSLPFSHQPADSSGSRNLSRASQLRIRQLSLTERPHQ